MPARGSVRVGSRLLALFAAAHALVPPISAASMRVAPAIVTSILNLWAGRSTKDVSYASKATWMSVTAFGFITTLVVAFGVVPLELSWLMSLWLLLMGAAMFSEGHSADMQMMNYSGLVLVIAALFVPSFGSWYFMASASIGLPGLINGLLAPAK